MSEENKRENEWVAYLAGEDVVKPEPASSEEESFRDLQQSWELAGTVYSFQNSQPEKAWSVISQEMDQETKVIPLKRFSFLRYAAIFIALLSIGSITLLLTREQDPAAEQIAVSGPVMKVVKTEANPTEYTTLLLPDGSTVKLNASSTLQYPDHFSGDTRKVILDGEGYFEVVHDASHPFVVEISNAIVEDLGTAFNVSAYPGKEKVEVNVTSGSVRLSDKSRKESAVLDAGSSGKYFTGKDKIILSNELSSNYLSWITKEVSFHHTPLSTVFEELRNIYHVPIQIADPKIANIAYTANFEKFQLEDIVNIIAKTHHLDVTKKDDGYIFSLK